MNLLVITCHDGLVERLRMAFEGAGHRITSISDPLEALALWAEGLRAAAHAEGLPVPFLGGAVGWIDFSAFALAEPGLEASFPAARTPRLRFGRFATGLVLDHLKQQGYLYHFPAPGEAASVGNARLAHLRLRLEGALPPLRQAGGFRLGPHMGSGAGAVGLAKGMAAGNERHRFLVVHRHARERLTNVPRCGDRIRIAVGPFRVDVN